MTERRGRATPAPVLDRLNEAERSYDRKGRRKRISSAASTMINATRRDPTKRSNFS